jgi:hypothetical protein
MLAFQCVVDICSGSLEACAHIDWFLEGLAIARFYRTTIYDDRGAVVSTHAHNYTLISISTMCLHH